MPAAESTIVFLPRFTTLLAGTHTTQPLDVSQFASAQFQFWRGADFAAPTSAVTVYLEESLDCVAWTLGASSPKSVVVAAEKSKFFSYGFRLRWFRLRVVVDPAMVTCWSEGILR